MNKDFEQKYKKYKKKYLNLKNYQKGGYDSYDDESAFVLDGPSVMYYFSNIKGKKILLFGEYHFVYETCKNQEDYLKYFKYQTDILRFINYLAKKNYENNTCLDFLCEHNFYENSSKENFRIYKKLENELLNVNKDFFEINNKSAIEKRKELKLDVLHILNYYFKRSNCSYSKNNKLIKENSIKYKCYKGFRYHYFDLFWYLKKKNKLGNIFIVHPFGLLFSNHFYKKKLILNDFFKTNYKNDNNKDFRYKFMLSLYNYLSGNKKKRRLYNYGKKILKEILDYLKKNTEDRQTYFILMTIKEVEDTSALIQKQIKNIDSKYFTAESLYNFWLNKIEIITDDHLNFPDTLIKFMRLSLLDTYSIARMFRKFKPKRKIKNCEGKKSMMNIIYYGGGAHTNNINDFIQWQFNIKPDINIKPNINDKGPDQCLVIPNFSPFEFKMPWDKN